MLAWYIVNWILFGVNFATSKISGNEWDEDDNVGYSVATILGVGTFFNLCSILSTLEDFEFLSGYKRYMRTAQSGLVDNIYLTFKQVKQFYVINPKSWKVSNNEIVYTSSDGSRFVVLFHNPIDFYRTMFFFRNETKKSSIQKLSIEDQNMKRFLEYVRKDIDVLNAQAEKEFDEARSLMGKIQDGNLD